MRQFQESITVTTKGQGLHEITNQVRSLVRQSEIHTGLCTVFIQHTSASLLIQENADPSARHDIETYMTRLAPENDPHYTHTAEGADDMPAHLRSMLTQSAELIPIRGQQLGLGTWQGLYVFEHRRGRHNRRLIVHILGE